MKVGYSLTSQTEADFVLDRILATACPNCDPPQKFCANANCPDGLLLTTTCVPTSQADADALAAAAAAAMLPSCDDPSQLFQATCACPDGTNPTTVYSNVSEEVALAQCEVIPKTCVGPGACNAEQCCDFYLPPVQHHAHWCVPAGTICAASLADANAMAHSLACVYANTPTRLSALSSFLCVSESSNQLITLAPILPGMLGGFVWAMTIATAPPGLTLHQLTPFSAELSGTPTTTGTYTFTIRASLFPNNYIERQYTMVVFGFTTAPDLPDGQAGTDYTQQIIADGGSGNYLFEITDGALPEGLALGPTGFITGTPTTEETGIFTVRVTDLVTTSMVCSLEFQLDIGPALSVWATATIITAVKSHYAIGLNQVALFGDCRLIAGSTDVTGDVTYREGVTFLGLGPCGLYGLAAGAGLGFVLASKIVHGSLVGSGSYLNSTSADMEVFGVNYWPNQVHIDGISLAAFQVLKPTVGGTLTIDAIGTFIYNDPSFSLQLLQGSTLVFQWPGNFAVYKRHENSLVPTGYFHFYEGTASPVSAVTIT